MIGVPLNVAGAAVAGAGIAVAAPAITALSQEALANPVQVVESRAGSGGGTTTRKPGLSPNQMQQQIRAGRAPTGLDRVDTPRVPGEQLHVHFRNGDALNIDGSWKDGRGFNLTRDQKDWLIRNGWTIP